MDNQPTFSEHRISRGTGNLYARDYAGAGAAFVMMHGFPDNLSDLPQQVAAEMLKPSVAGVPAWR